MDIATAQVVIEGGILVALVVIAANTSTIARKTGEGGNEGRETPVPKAKADSNDDEKS